MSVFRAIFLILRGLVRGRAALALENLALRQAVGGAPEANGPGCGGGTGYGGGNCLRPAMPGAAAAMALSVEVRITSGSGGSGR